MIRLLANKFQIRSGANKLILFFFFCFSLVFLSSCFKPGGQIGDVIQPDQSKLKIFYSDSSTVYAYSMPEDSVRTDELTIANFGSIYDPVFGNTTASIYTQFSLSSLANDFGEAPVFDSLFLYLYYTGTSYGDTNTTLKLRVYELNESLYYDSAYYSNSTLELNPVDFADSSFEPYPHDSLILGPDTLPPMIRVNLSANPELGNKLVNATEDDMASDEAFKEFFKGLFITTDPVGSGGSIVSFNLLSTFSRMTIFYHNSEEDSLYYNYLISGDDARVSKYQHDFSSGDMLFKQQVIDDDTLLGSTQFYVQGLGGVKSLIKFPYLGEWNKMGNVAVNEAKLTLSGFETIPYNGAPEKIILVRALEDGNYEILDDNLEYAGYFGGEYKSSLNQYQFRLTDYVQERISNPYAPDYGLYLFVYGSSIYPQRFIFNGNEPQSDTIARLKLEIIYTDL